MPLLAARGYGVDVFVDDRHLPAVARASHDPPEAGEVRVLSAHDFVWRTARRQHDLAVYQIGNSRLHAFVWPYLLRWPGLAVLHDARLHHARAQALLTSGHDDVYRAEFAWNHPGVAIDATELAVLGYDGTYYYQWPMLRTIVEASKLVATHSRGVQRELEAEWPNRPFEYVALGEGRVVPVADTRRRARRQALGLADDAICFGVFGGLTADKRLPQILRAFRSTAARVPQARLALAGTIAADLDLRQLARHLGIESAVAIVESPDDDQFDELIAAIDVGVHLRWPTARETSGPWIRALAASRPTVITDLAHQAHLPVLDPRTWELHGPRDPRADATDAIAVAVDLRDEEHSLAVAMQRLARDPELRDRLGRAARRFWETEHTVERMAADYERTIARAGDLPAPENVLPSALRPEFLRPVEHDVTAAFTGVGFDWPSSLRLRP